MHRRLKPSELAPLNALQLAELISRTDVPPGVFNLVTGDGPGTGRERDWEFAAEARRAELVSGDVLLARVDDLPVGDDTRAHIERMLRALLTDG